MDSWPAKRHLDRVEWRLSCTGLQLWFCSCSFLASSLPTSQSEKVRVVCLAFTYPSPLPNWQIDLATDNVLPTESPLTTPTPFTENEVRLDDYILPTGYRLEVKSDQEKNQFSGTVNIDIEIKRDADLLRIHCKNLEIKDYKLKDSTGTVVLFRNVQIDTRLELCLFIPKEKIPSKSYILTIEYTGKFMPGQITGFYKSNYTTVDNQVRHLTATKFEPTYARMAFPCFDEPKFKTKFDISVIHARSQVALSNEIEQSIVLLEDGWTKTTFKQTAPMPTYLVAFIVCDFKYTETRTNFGTRVCLHTFVLILYSYILCSLIGSCLLKTRPNWQNSIRPRNCGTSFALLRELHRHSVCLHQVR